MASTKVLAKYSGMKAKVRAIRAARQTGISAYLRTSAAHTATLPMAINKTVANRMVCCRLLMPSL